MLRHACLAFSLTCPSAEPAEPAPAAPPSAASGAPAAAPTSAAREGGELVGEPAREFVDLAWLDGQPRTLAGLRGKVVLVRFWTETCPYCRGTAPKLRRLDADLRSRGLVVVGLYHPKPRGRSVALADVRASADAWSIEFPVALDPRWATLDAWWLKTGDRSATSASFLIDCSGIVRLVHPGPEYSDAEYSELQTTIHRLLADCS